jgi:hypothetical protein
MAWGVFAVRVRNPDRRWWQVWKPRYYLRRMSLTQLQREMNIQRLRMLRSLEDEAGAA